jgi:hypothetical protein
MFEFLINVLKRLKEGGKGGGAWLCLHYLLVYL